MATESADAVIVGGGIVGLSTAYYLGEAGISAGSHQGVQDANVRNARRCR